MNNRILTEISNFALVTASNSKDRMVHTYQIKKEFGCSDDNINELEDIISPYGIIQKGFGDQRWNTFILNQDLVEPVKSGNFTV